VRWVKRESEGVDRGEVGVREGGREEERRRAGEEMVGGVSGMWDEV